MRDVIRIEIEMEQEMSTESKKTSSEYYELKLQVRFNYYDSIEEIQKETFDLVTNMFDTINKIDELSNGFDIYFRTRREMGKISSLFNKKYLIEEKRSKKIVGRDHLTSKDKFRYIQVITLINLKKEDKVEIKGEKFSIKSINNNDLVLIDEETGSKKVVTYSIIKDYLKVLRK